MGEVCSEEGGTPLSHASLRSCHTFVLTDTLVPADAAMPWLLASEA